METIESMKEIKQEKKGRQAAVMGRPEIEIYQGW